LRYQMVRKKKRGAGATGGIVACQKIEMETRGLQDKPRKKKKSWAHRLLTIRGVEGTPE